MSSYICPRCGKAFTRKRTLDVHLNGFTRKSDGKMTQPPGCKIRPGETRTPELKSQSAEMPSSTVKNESELTPSFIATLPQSDDPVSVETFLEKKNEVVTGMPVASVTLAEARRIRLNERIGKFMSSSFAGIANSFASGFREKNGRPPLSRKRQEVVEDLFGIAQEVFGADFDVIPKSFTIRNPLFILVGIGAAFAGIVIMPEDGEKLALKPAAPAKSPAPLPVPEKQRGKIPEGATELAPKVAENKIYQLGHAELWRDGDTYWEKENGWIGSIERGAIIKEI